MSATMYWSEAKWEARELSARDGFAWIVIGSDGLYSVVASDSVEDAPEAFEAEFKDGEQQ